MNSKSLKQYTKIISRYGLRMEHAGSHYKVYTRDARVVATVAGTGEANALRQSLRDLRRGGYVDDDACKVKF